MNRAQHDEGKRLEFCDRTQWKQQGPNSEKGKEKTLIDRKTAFTWNVEGIYN
jgi:hypothetical protein